MRRALLSFTFLAFCIASTQANAIRLGLGGSISNPYLLISAKGHETYGDNDRLVLLRKKKSSFPIAPAFIIGSEDSYFGDRKIGWLIDFWAGTYQLDRTSAKKEENKDLDSPVSGLYAYLTPVLYYNWGDKLDPNKKDQKGFKLLTGMGLGLSYLTVKGKVPFSELDEDNPPEEDFDVKSINRSTGLFVHFEKANYFVRITNYAPLAEKDGYRMSLHNIALTVGYFFNIPLSSIGLGAIENLSGGGKKATDTKDEINKEATDAKDEINKGVTDTKDAINKKATDIKEAIDKK